LERQKAKGNKTNNKHKTSNKRRDNKDELHIERIEPLASTLLRQS
jgi:hypothetical protein